MATGHSVIPLDGGKDASAAIEWLKVAMVYVPDDLPPGRFPTVAELRHAIHEFGYQLEETHDWYVTSDDDHTEIWFSDGIGAEDQPTGFWFRRGHLITLDIIQSLANQCGSFIVADHSSAGYIVIVPDSVFDVTSQGQAGFVSVFIHRIPAMLNRLAEATLDDTLFLLSQFRETLRRLDRLYQHGLFESVQQGLSVFAHLLKHDDARIRFFAFDLVATYPEHRHTYNDALGITIKNETDADTKARMIWATEHLIGKRNSLNIDRWTQALFDVLLEECNDTQNVLPVRFASANILTRSMPGFLTPVIREIFIDALVQPEMSEASWDEFDIQKTLESIEKLLLHHRVDILLTALPNIAYAQDAHEVLRALLDNVFFGAVRSTGMSSPLGTHNAERPEVDEKRFREHRSRAWLYTENPTKISVTELLPFQREILETVLDFNIPWMVHSNLLEKYGLPATRAAVRALLDETISG